MSRTAGMTLLAVCLIVVGAHAGTYSQNFDAAANGATNLGDGSTIVDSGTGLALVFDFGAWKALRLTQDGETGFGMTGNYVLPDLDTGKAITGFTATFDLLIKNDYNAAADGFSFNFGAIPTLPIGGEDGMYDLGTGHMLSVGWDTYGVDANRIDLFVDGVSIANAAASIVTGNINDPFKSVSITLDENGLDVSYDGSAIFTDYAVGFTPVASDQFGFAARTGAENQDTFIDNVNVTTTPVPEPATIALLAMGGLAMFKRRKK